MLYTGAFCLENGMKKVITLIALTALSLFLISGCSRTIEEKLNQVENHLKTGHFTKAGKIVDEIVQVDSLAPEAIYGQALLKEYQSFEWDAMIDNIDASRMRDGYLPSMRAFIRTAIQLDYLDNARKMIRAFIKRQSENPDGYYYLVAVDLKENKLDSARANLARAASLTDDNLTLILIEAEIDFHSYDESLINAALEKLSRTKFKTPEQFSRLATLYHYLNMGDSAIHYSRRVVERDRKNVKARLQLAQYLFDEMRLVEANDVVAGIIADAEEYGAAQILASHILWAMGKENTAEQHFFKFMVRNKRSPIAFEKHGDFYSFFGGNSMATIEWQAAYIMAYNLKYPDDYLRRIYLKMQNGFLDDRDVSAGADNFEEGRELMAGYVELDFIEAELKSHFDNTVDSAKMLVEYQLDRHRNDRKWMELAGRYFFRQNKSDQAKDVFATLIKMPYPKLDYYLKLLETYKSNKDAAAADMLNESLPLRFKGSLRFHEIMRDLYSEAGQMDKTVEYAERLYRHTTEYMPYILTMTDLYMTQNRKDDARNLLTKFMEDFPQNPEGYYQLAKFDYRNGEYDLVMQNIEQSLAIDTGYAYSIELMGEYYQNMGNMDSAMSCYERAIKLHWRTPIAYHNLAEHLLQNQEDLDRAGGLAMAAISYFERDRRGYLLLGNIYWTQGKFKMARLQYYRGAQLFSDDAELHFLLGRAHLKMDEKAKAKSSLKKALDLNLPSPQKEEAQSLLSGL